MGHGAAGEGGLAWIHLGNDMVHILAAAGWIGALAVFALWLRREMPVAALRDFSGFGIAFAGMLVVTGVGNGFFMLGAPSQLWRSLYGLVLMAKLVLFLGMLGLAARNRMAVRTGGDGVQRALWVETGLGFVVLAVVAWLGMLEPPR
jgi:putative copper resistance protein D